MKCSNTYNHRTQKSLNPVRSSIDNIGTGRLVVRWNEKVGKHRNLLCQLLGFVFLHKYGRTLSVDGGSHGMPCLEAETSDLLTLHGDIPSLFNLLSREEIAGRQSFQVCWGNLKHKDPVIFLLKIKARLTEIRWRDRPAFYTSFRYLAKPPPPYYYCRHNMAAPSPGYETLYLELSRLFALVAYRSDRRDFIDARLLHELRRGHMANDSTRERDPNKSSELTIYLHGYDIA
ncbi:hypothetical protein BDR25DRAFT_357596 [Lindgomyces ingoldianus]|uniref:Uncharacterized protein n=1 Tax=Lindgomyces ingoldianus TaxID=673940 RepID=A0ACB6QN20_9PLEO|nr:hypothetical protein BDR25DRAFT_357596 [Lindgomyces ingoldianus]